MSMLQNWMFNSGSVRSYWTRSKFQEEETFDNGKVVLTFDDGWLSVYNNALPLLLEKDVKATFYVAPGEFGGSANYLGTDYPIMTGENAVAMHEAGMDMQCHTNEFASMLIRTDEQLVASLTAVNNAFTALGLPVPQHLAYPGGFFDDRVINAIKDLRLTARSITSEPMYRNSSRYDLRGIAINLDKATVKAAMDVAKANKSALILIGHMVNDTYPVLSISSADLAELIDYGKAIGLDFETIKSLYDKMFYVDLRASRLGDDNQIDLTFNW